MDDQDKREEHATMLSYFHKDKGDMRRYCDFDEAIELFPEVKRALADHEYYSNVLDAVVEKALNN